jgi:hypothetical protein
VRKTPYNGHPQKATISGSVELDLLLAPGRESEAVDERLGLLTPVTDVATPFTLEEREKLFEAIREASALLGRNEPVRVRVVQED